MERLLFHLRGLQCFSDLRAPRLCKVWRGHVSKVLICLLPPASQPEEELLGPREPTTCPLHGHRDLDLLPNASSGRRERCDGLVGMDDFLMQPEHQTRVQGRLSVDALHSWALTRVYLQSCHSPSLCFAARFLYSVLISQGSSFGLIIPTGINRTAAAVLASAASFAEQQCGLLDKAGAGSQEH